MTTVGINLLWLVPGDVGGSEQSTVASVQALHELAPPDLDLRLFVLAPFAAAHPDVAAAVAMEVLPLSGRSRALRVLREAPWLRRRAKALDLLHHAGGTAPVRGDVPYVLTIHDLQPLERVATHGRVKRAYLGRALPKAVEGARAIAVPSEYVRRSVLARFPVAPERVVAIPHGVAWSPRRATPADEVRARYRLRGPVVLYPAITYPHKDHATLIAAFALVRLKHPDAVLVLSGGEGSREAAVQAQVARLGLEEHVRRTGRISDADVAGLYGVASVVAVPSTYEGFGLPAAEAMAAGVALVAADATALPEVVGDAGLLVAPGDVAAWAATISELLADARERAHLVERGRRRAQQYTWAANATALAELYRDASAPP